MNINELIANPMLTGLIGLGLPLVAGLLYGAFVMARKSLKFRSHLYNIGYQIGNQLKKVSAKLNGKNLVDYRAYCKSLANYVDMGIEDAIDGKPKRSIKEA